MNLSDQVQEYIEVQPVGNPIMASEIVDEMLPARYTEEEEKKIRQNVYVIVARLLRKGNGLERYASGIYYRTDDESKEISKKILVERLFLNSLQGEVMGYVTGSSFAWEQGFLERKPRKLHIASNNWRKQADEDDLSIEISAPPRCVTDQNVEILQLLDLLKWDLELTCSESNCKKIATYVYEHDLDPLEIMSLAVQCYSQKVVLNLAKLTPYYIRICKHHAVKEPTY